MSRGRTLRRVVAGVALIVALLGTVYVLSARSLEDTFRRLVKRELDVEFVTLKYAEDESLTDIGGAWLIGADAGLAKALRADARFGVADEADTAYYMDVVTDRGWLPAGASSPTLYRGHVVLPGTPCDPYHCAVYFLVFANTPIAYAELHKF